MELHINLLGIIFITLALVHVIFPKYFDWRRELRHLSVINREMMVVHTFFIALTVFLMGVLCVTSAHELTSTILGKRICLGIGVFWALRLVVQFFGYSKELWLGKKFETAVHIVFSVLWVYASVVFLMVYFEL